MDFSTIECNFKTLPSKLWAIHLDSLKKYIAILHIDVKNNEIIVDKGIVLYNKNYELFLEADIFIHNQLTKIPNINKRISNIDELNQLVINVDMINLCAGYDRKIPNSTCTMFCDNTKTDYCSNCLIFNLEQNQKKMQNNYISSLCDNLIINDTSQDAYVLSESELLPIKLPAEDSVTCFANFPNSHMFKTDFVTQSATNNDICDTKSITASAKCICHICGVIFVSFELLNEHLTVHIVDSKIENTNCRQLHNDLNLKNIENFPPLSNVKVLVNKSTYSADKDTEKHKIKKNKQEEIINKPLQCELCEKYIPSATHLRIHMRRHTGDLPFSCDICNKRFFSKSHLKEHYRTHTKERPFTCPVCNKTSSYQSAHKRHVASHTQGKRNLCTVCGKTFCKGYRLQDHMLTHSNERPFECEICLKRFAKSANLKIHLKTHTGARPYACSLCGKTYTTQSNLSTHMSNHTGKKPHVCGACGKRFVHPRLLRIHVRIHTGEKPYKCTICGKSFAKNIHLTTHMRVHTGEKPYICFKCGKGFTTSGNLAAHHKVHHEDYISKKEEMR